MKLSSRLVTMLFFVAGSVAACDPVVVTEHLGKLRPKPTPDPTQCDCGPNRPAISCANGQDNWVCQPSDDAASCAWQLECGGDKPAPPPCGPDECKGPAPLAANVMCADGSVAGPACVRDDAGSCGWTVLGCDDTKIACEGLDQMTCAATQGCSWFETRSAAPCGPEGCIGGGGCAPTSGGSGTPTVGGTVGSDGAGSSGTPGVVTSTNR